MKDILDENGDVICSIKPSIKKAVQIFSKTVVEEVDKILEETKVKSIKIILDLTAGNVAKYDVIIEKFINDNGHAMAIVEQIKEKLECKNE